MTFTWVSICRGNLQLAVVTWQSCDHTNYKVDKFFTTCAVFLSLSVLRVFCSQNCCTTIQEPTLCDNTHGEHWHTNPKKLKLIGHMSLCSEWCSPAKSLSLSHIGPLSSPLKFHILQPLVSTLDWMALAVQYHVSTTNRQQWGVFLIVAGLLRDCWPLSRVLGTVNVGGLQSGPIRL